jgi:hypothetical protein
VFKKADAGGPSQRSIPGAPSPLFVQAVRRRVWVLGLGSVEDDYRIA